MPLRLRRGTNTERQLITPQEGELIYVTDTKELWAGDGTTQGGIKVTGIVPESLNDLSDVNLFVAPQIGQVLKWNGAAFVAADDNNTGTSNSGIIEGSSYNINIIRDDSTVMVNSLTGIFTGNLEGNVVGNLQGNVTGDLQGNVLGTLEGNVLAADSSIMIDSNTSMFYGDGSNLTNLVLQEGSAQRINILGADSTVMVDYSTSSFNGRLNGDVYSSSSDYAIVDSFNNVVNPETLIVSNPQLSVLSIDITNPVGSSNGTKLSFKGFDGTISNPIEPADFSRQGISFDFYDGTTYQTESIIYAYHQTSGAGYIALAVSNAAGSLFGTSVELDGLADTVVVTGGVLASKYVKFGSYTTVNRDLITAENGMLIYNSTDNRFQGYQNGAWINIDDGTTA